MCPLVKKRFSIFPLSLVVLLLQVACVHRPTTQRQSGEHRLHRLEPADGVVLPGIGQDPVALGDYLQALPAGAPKPVIYNDYVVITWASEKLNYMMTGKVQEKPQVGAVPLEDLPYVALQIGVNLTPEGDLEKIAAGDMDDKITRMCDTFAEIGRPVYLRIGYEFNGEWNNYEPELYKKAWRRMASLVYAHSFDQIALVWCYAPEGARTDYMAWYPGDQWVDWWAIDLFSPEHLDSKLTNDFILHAADRGYPVMIAECSPRWVGAHSEQAWNVWFKRFFKIFEKHPNVKAFCYISWNWEDHYPKSGFMKYWGDGRIHATSERFGPWLNELGKERYGKGGAPRLVRDLIIDPVD